MIDLHNSNIAILLAGICFFLYGMTVVSQSLEKLLAAKISQLFNKLTDNKFLAILVGVTLTVILQSSAAVTSMLVGLGSARVINIQQVMGVIIGTAIGSTVTVQLLSLNLYEWSLPLFIVGFFTYFRSQKNIFKNMALVLMGFAFVFMGLRMVSVAAEVFVSHPLLTEFFKSVHNNPVLSFIASMVFCSIFQSSAVTIGLAMSLATVQAISLDDALVWVLGANVGTTTVAIMASLNSNNIGKQVAWAHFFYKTVAAMIFFPFVPLLSEFFLSFNTTMARGVANAHFLFNICSAVLFFPFINWGARFIENMFPRSQQEEFGTAFVGLENYQTAPLALAYAQREVQRTGDIVLGMIKDSVRLFETHADHQTLIQSIRDRDNQVDFLYRETKMYLLDHVNKGQSSVQKSTMDLIMFLSDLERAADLIDINLVGLAEKKYNLKLEFSEEGKKEIHLIHEEVCKVAAMAMNSFHKSKLSKETIQLKRNLAKTEMQLRENHIGRLNQGIQSSIKTSSIHLDVLSEYKRIASLLCNHAYKDSRRKDRE